MKGEKGVRNVAKLAQYLGVRPSRIYHSGKRRAEQTAKILGEALRKPVDAAQGLSPNDDVRPWRDRIFQEKGDMMLVGHLPFLEKLASLLIADDPGARPVLFSYGAVICLDQKTEGGWGVRWILTPEMVSVEDI